MFQKDKNTQNYVVDFILFLKHHFSLSNKHHSFSKVDKLLTLMIKRKM